MGKAEFPKNSREPTIYVEDKQLAMTRKFAGAGQCGILTIYEWSESSLGRKSPFKIKDVWGNNDCANPMLIDDWPKIHQNCLGLQLS